VLILTYPNGHKLVGPARSKEELLEQLKELNPFFARFWQLALQHGYQIKEVPDPLKLVIDNSERKPRTSIACFKGKCPTN